MSKKTTQIDITPPTWENREKSYKYDAFISCRNIQPDQSIAQKLHKMIETFKVPKKYNDGGSRSRLNAFLDKEEPSAGHLSTHVKEALKDSKYLIVICSKRLKFSEWCLMEIRFFLSLHKDGGKRIIPILIEGDCDKSFPDDLKKAFNHNLSMDIRPCEVQQAGFMSYNKLQDKDRLELDRLGEESIDLLKKKKNKIIAILLGCFVEDLEQRDKIQKIKRLILIFVCIVVMLSIICDLDPSAKSSRREDLRFGMSILMESSRGRVQH